MTPLTPVHVTLTGCNGNIFHLTALVCRALRDADYAAEAERLPEEVWTCQSYEEAKRLLASYVHVTW